MHIGGLSNLKRFFVGVLIAVSTMLLCACMQKGANPDDPYEVMNRKTHAFNMAFDATMLRPPASLYKTILPPPVRNGVNNFFNNIAMLPTVANDLLQADLNYAVRDSWRFFINSTFGIAGIFDVADKHFGLPPHYNDLGLTFARWGDCDSPYLVLPILGPSTIRDGVGLIFDYTILSPYCYIPNDGIIFGLAALRFVDLRSQMFATEPIIDEALDKYAFIRDAYLQHRKFRMTGSDKETGALYVEAANEVELENYVDE